MRLPPPGMKTAAPDRATLNCTAPSADCRTFSSTATGDPLIVRLEASSATLMMRPFCAYSNEPFDR